MCVNLQHNRKAVTGKHCWKVAFFLAMATTFVPSGIAAAGTANTTFQVTAIVPAECIIAATDLAFGTYSVIAGTAVQGNTSVDVTCSGGTPFEVSLGTGTGAGATIATRKMTSGTNTLDYTLYRDAGRTQVWGQTAGTDTVSGAGIGTVQTIAVYGTISASQAAFAGAYVDTITAIITF